MIMQRLFRSGLLRHIRDTANFLQLPKQQRRIVFYSEGKTYWVHLRALLQAFLDESDIPVCYISSGTDDPGLTLQHARLRQFKIDEGAVRNWLFENIDTDIMVMTMPDIGQYQVKRSKHPVHYVYVQHSLVSKHMVYRPGAFDHYDSIFCAGPHHFTEMQAICQHKGLAQKNLVEHGYARLDSILDNANKTEHSRREQTHVLLAPSWGEQSISNTIGAELVAKLLAADFFVTFRPHPQTLKFSRPLIDDIANQHANNDNFVLEADVSSESSLHQSDIMICDWSGAALDYAFGLEKPVLFINVPRKINDPTYTELDIEPFEVSVREKIGAVIEAKDIDEISARVRGLLLDHNTSSLAQLRAQSVFNVGNSAAKGAAALLELL